MKKYLLMLVAVASFALLSCNKVSDFPENDQPQTEYQRESGALPDPPELKKQFPLRASQEFIDHGRTIAFTKTKQLYADMRADDALAEFNTAAKGSVKGPGKGWGSGGSSGGTTSGGGGTTTSGDGVPPITAITSPRAGQVYNLNNLTWQSMNWAVMVADDWSGVAKVLVKIKGDTVLLTTGPFKPVGGGYNSYSGTYNFPYGDGTYDITAQAWDSAGNTTITTVLFSRSTEMTALPSNFPSSYKLPYPKVDAYIQQGGEGSCAAFAATSAFTIQKYVRGGLTGGYNNNNVYSPEWVYNIAVAGSGCGSGSSTTQDMGIIVNRGVPTWAYLPYSSQNGCDTSIFTPDIRANAALNKGAWGFSAAFADMNAIKYNVSKGYVAVFGFQLDHQINGGFLYPGFIWTFPHFQDGGPHAACIIGYDDSKHAFLMLNSWGTSWGDGGTIWVDYDFMWQCVSGAGYYFGN